MDEGPSLNMSERKELIIKRLQEEGAKTVEFFRSIPENNFQQQVYTTGPQWDARNLLAHFVSAERTFAFYGRDILNGGEGAPEDFVIDEFNETQVGRMKTASASDLIEQFEEARASTIHLIESMSDADLGPRWQTPVVRQSPARKYVEAHLSPQHDPPTRHQESA